jgi:hypothetical protein
VQILSGLQPGERIISLGKENVVDGSFVRVVPKPGETLPKEEPSTNAEPQTNAESPTNTEPSANNAPLAPETDGE